MADEEEDKSSEAVTIERAGSPVSYFGDDEVEEEEMESKNTEEVVVNEILEKIKNLKARSEAYQQQMHKQQRTWKIEAAEIEQVLQRHGSTGEMNTEVIIIII